MSTVWKLLPFKELHFSVFQSALESVTSSLVVKKVHFLHLNLLLVFTALSLNSTVCRAQSRPVNVRIEVASVSPARLSVQIESSPTDRWSFRNVYGDILNLANRIGNFRAVDSQGESVSVRTVALGEFQSGRSVPKITYEVRVSGPSDLAQMSHVSWLNQERGLLMLGDLLPEINSESTATVVDFKLPESWKVSSSLRHDDKGQYPVPQVNEAVFYVGRSLHEQTIRINSMELALITSGEWPFVDREALKVANKVASYYAKALNYPLSGRFAIMLAPFPAAPAPRRWSAETRGPNVAIVMRNKADRRQVLGQLSILFTHELLHLWVPNALGLAGNYDWFFEGFTLYQALLTALELDFITFNEYLNTIARVYDSYGLSAARDSLSLIEASKLRWTRSPSYIYDKGFLVALIYDLSVRQTSGNKRSLTDVYRGLFRSSTERRESANEVIMAELNSSEGMSQFSQQYVESAQAIALQTLLAPHGFKINTQDGHTRIVVQKDLSDAQRKLLGSLGYKH